MLKDINIQTDGHSVLVWSFEEKKFWYLKTGCLDLPEECIAPQMFNISSGMFYVEENIKDEYPFDRAREIGDKIKARIDMQLFFLSSLDPCLELSSRKKCVNIINKFDLGEIKNKLAFDCLSDLLINSLPIRKLEASKEVVSCMQDEFKKLTQKIFKKHEGVDIEI